MSKSNQIQCAYEKKLQPFIEALRRMPKKSITLSPRAAWLCIEEGFHPSDFESAFSEPQNEPEKHFPRTLSDGAAKLLTQADLDRFFSREMGPKNVIFNAIAFQNMAFWDADKETRGSFHAYHQALAERFVRIALKCRDHRRMKKRRGGG
jgi:hypothetical protein